MTGYTFVARGGDLKSAALPVFDLGLAPYEPLQSLQGRLRQAVGDGLAAGVLLLLEHEPVITLGRRGNDQDLRPATTCSPAREETTYSPVRDETTCSPARDENSIPVVRSERGGRATLHAPGQLICYPVVPVPGRDLGRYVRNLEECLVVLLGRYGIRAERRPGHPGLYVAGRKIASVGLRCQRWVTSHGTSLNVNVDPALFDAIVSCGEPDLQQTSMRSLCSAPLVMAEVKDEYCRAVGEVFGWRLARTRRLVFSQVEQVLGL